ncbi:Nif3-like dinuclear metal center hexameric protein [Alloscardovia omnicolens]|uniref:Nif3-like dinuclear metal center hexameric protein n=1 Tax=Alloscardovia omnicolens TaxID=419015 RepID=UPI002549EA80|nr:Nif3-like dinuclear metal center hexameric protein [Alloscardovia omnicolens]MDK6445198.1 Nif3-like dinuclear metal center hexameric protein [Alloscardovia omnicolens]
MNVGQIVDVLEELYPLDLAEDWDEPGLIVGNPQWGVHTIYCAVDPTEETVNDAIAHGAQLMITHHPLYFKATHTVAGSTFRGALVTKLIENHCALWVGHTNVDSAERGQGFAFIDVMRLKDQGPLVPHRDNPARGLGRIGKFDTPILLGDFALDIAHNLPHTESGVQVSGDPFQEISRVAVLPGSGDSEIMAAARSGADVYVTSDLRHHPVLDARQETGLAFINTPHAAIEKLVFNLMVQDVPAAVRARYNEEIEMLITSINTDPWNVRF